MTCPCNTVPALAPALVPVCLCVCMCACVPVPVPVPVPVSVPVCLCACVPVSEYCKPVKKVEHTSTCRLVYDQCVCVCICACVCDVMGGCCADGRGCRLLAAQIFNPALHCQTCSRVGGNDVRPPPPWPTTVRPFNPHFLVYAVVSLHTCVLPCK